MRKQFAELYLRVCAEPKPEQLEKRWQGIEEYCKQDEADIYNLVKMAYSHALRRFAAFARCLRLLYLTHATEQSFRDCSVENALFYGQKLI